MKFQINGKQNSVAKIFRARLLSWFDTELLDCECSGEQSMLFLACMNYGRNLKLRTKFGFGGFSD